MTKKLSISVRITDCTPGHTWFRLYSNLILEEYDHDQVSRASLGEPICLRNEEFKPFMHRLQPDLYTLSDKVTCFTIKQRTGLHLDYIPVRDYQDTDYLTEVVYALCRDCGREFKKHELSANALCSTCNQWYVDSFGE